MSGLIGELKRRNVVRVGAAYMVVGWIVMQVIDVVIEPLRLPEWTATLVLVLLLVGLPITLFLAWAFELTPEGVKKTEEVDADASITPSTGRKLNLVIISGLALALGYFIWEARFAGEPGTTAPIEVAGEVAGEEPSDQRITIAVLPFTDLSAARDQEYFGDGIAEAIINRLVSLDGLKVTSRTSAFSFKDSNMSIPEIAAELDARYVLEGSVRSAGNQLRITAQLIEVASDTHLWSETYDRQMDDIFAVQDDISASIATTLKVRLVGGLTTDPPTDSFEAYRLYLQGHHLFLQRGAANLEKAIEYFTEAIALDPEFAEAWADLATSNAVLPAYTLAVDLKATILRAGEAADRALELDPALAQSWAAKGTVLMWVFEWAEARAALERAVELNPENDNAWFYLGLSYLYAGFFADAQTMLERAHEIAPQSGINNGALGRAQLGQGDVDAARQSFEQAIALGWPQAHFSMLKLAAIEGDGERIVEEAARSTALYEEPYGDRLSIYAKAFVDPTGREAALALLKDDIAQQRHMQSMLGGLLLHDGESFIQSVQTSNPGWFLSMLWTEPFRPMLKQQAVKDYLVRINLVDFWREAGWPDFCRPLGDDDFECGVFE